MAVFSEYLATAFFVLLGLFLWSTLSRRRKGLPPGPIPLPLIGNVLQIGRKPHLTLSNFSKKYGPIFMIKMGTLDVVMINDHKLLKELFSDNASTGRMLDNPAIYEFTKGPNGVINSEGATWEAQRRFTLRTLRDFGFAKTSMEVLILDEARAMLDWFKKSNGKAITGNRIFNAPVVNSLWRIVTGERCEWEEKRPRILDYADEFFKSMMQISTNGILFAPILRLIAPEYLGWNRYKNGVGNLFRLFDESIQKHRETFDPNTMRDFIDHHLMETSNAKDPDSSFSGKAGYTNMVAGVFDLFVGGSETTSHTLSWILLYLSHHQEVQKSVQKEIDEAVGNRTPSLSDRPAMPYTEAVIMEVLRKTTVISMGVPHRMIEDKIFHGYCLPKGIAIFGNTYAIHHDPAVWGDPEVFRPERFLSEDRTKVVRHEGLVPFSEGKRKCIGETLAKDTLFLFTVSIFQKFNVLSESNSGDGKAAKEPDFEPDFGYFLTPKPFKVVMSQR